jgi:hypothetical protein
LFKQFGGNSLVERVFREFIYLELDVLIWVLVAQLFCVLVNDGFDVEVAAGAELEVLCVAEHESLVADVLVDGTVEQVGELIDGEVLGDEVEGVEVVDVACEYFLPGLCELDYFNQQFGNVVSYERRGFHGYSLLLACGFNEKVVERAMVSQEAVMLKKGQGRGGF